MAKVLVIDDDRSLMRALAVGLAALGHEMVSAATGQGGISQVALVQPDVVVLDLGLPDIDGIEVCRRLRSWSSVPVIVLSATDVEGRKVAALDSGADDYVTKPFGMAELDARIRATLRRTQIPSEEPATVVTAGELKVDLLHKEARWGGRRLDLTSRELDLLAFLARHTGRVCTRQMILDAVWGPGYRSDSPHLRVYVRRLRQKLGDEAGSVVVSVPGIGYRLETGA